MKREGNLQRTNDKKEKQKRVDRMNERMKDKKGESNKVRQNEGENEW